MLPLIGIDRLIMIDVQQMDSEQKALLQDQKGNIGDAPPFWVRLSDSCKRHIGVISFIGVVIAFTGVMTAVFIGYVRISSNLDDRFADIEDKFFEQLSGIWKSANENAVTLARVDEGLDHLQEDMSDLKDEVSDIKNDVADLKSDVDVLRNEVNRIEENTKPNQRSDNVAFLSTAGY
ncbi:MAG: hypothetical protein F4Z15_01040 [Gammaproteobacteria bacterium]|nr:hypothetical protein [Gammaproteobacteria bacterium]